MATRILFLDCVGGVAGDMLLSALVEAADGPQAIVDLPQRLGLADVSLNWTAGRPGGFAARQLEVAFDADTHSTHRCLADIEEILEDASIDDRVRALAQAVFRRLAEAEARVHGATLDSVHFHEVGAVDALIDIVGTCAMLVALEIDEIVCSPLPMGHGTVECAHGTLPLPAPAVAAMLPDIPVYDARVEGETVTPTGAALVRELSSRFGPMPSMTVETVGIGAGSRVYPNLPNIVRAFIGVSTAEATDGAPLSENVVVECNIDDCDPRTLPGAIQSLLDAGALDAFLTPILMKKGRPGFLVTALAPSNLVETVVQAMLRETTTLGCRLYPVEKRMMDRRMQTVTTQWGEVPVKFAYLGGTVIRCVPEFDVCDELARRAGVPVQEVLESATSAARELKSD
ncbi:MAG: nickel pincer cofactor biosynthesis protein LarC [bacterium]|nr:nickel pincer cofactor biosynthesis protein LarC [bacterium]